MAENLIEETNEIEHRFFNTLFTMKKTICFLCIILLALSQTICANNLNVNNEPDSAYIFAYATNKNDNHNGLHIAWSTDKEVWHAIGPEYSLVKCDYSRWGSQKKMFSPYLFQTSDGLWHCIWSLNERDGAFAHVTSTDLIYWGRQSYPLVLPDGNCLTPETIFNADKKGYTVTWISNKSGKDELYGCFTKDFKKYTAAEKISNRNSTRKKVSISGTEETGTIHRVSWNVVANLIKAYNLSEYKQQQWAERVVIDPNSLKDPVKVSISIDTHRKKKISDQLLGIFFEDINYAADGGLYAELIQNRGFEYQPSDRGNDKNWNSYKAWTTSGNNVDFKIDSISPIHENNRHYAVLNINTIGSGLINEGWDGIPVEKGEKYDFSVFARSTEVKSGKLTIRLIGKNGENYGEISTKAVSKDWKRYEAVIIANQTANDARIEIIPLQTGRIDLDMISLFPQKTFKGRSNGLRADLAQVIADMKPRFVRFPGGCVAHGDGLENIYRWENTIGSLEARKPQRNIWGYQQSYGLGYFEYFQFCEDIGAEPLPVVAAGVPCQNSAHHGCPIGGQQGGIPMDKMDEYVQSVLNLIEYANGDVKSEWGRKRAEAGHPKPFGLKYIGVGNEDLITDIFEERFIMIYNAIKEKYPAITVIGTTGPFNEGTDYVEGWNLATKLNVPMVDEHYYQTPGWYLNNQDFYDKYDRSKPKVYLGEYAAHIPGRHNNIETALCEALHLANVERNGDIVTMTSYAPLLAKEGYTQWNPDLIYFNNTEVKPTVGYYIQMLYGQNSGDEYLPGTMAIENQSDAVRKRLAVSVVCDSKTGDLIVKLVNMLPVAVSPTLSIEDIIPDDAPVVKYVLKGELTDKTARPTESTCSVKEMLSGELPPYSFTVYRVKANVKAQ